MLCHLTIESELVLVSSVTICLVAAAEANEAVPSTSAPADDSDAVDILDEELEDTPARKSRKAAVFDSEEEDDAVPGDPDAVQQEPISGGGDINMAEVFGSEEEDD